MTKPVVLSNGRRWATQTLAKQHFKEMLSRYSTGEKVTNLSDHEDLKALLLAYDSVLQPGEETKIGTGLGYFTRQQNSADGYTTEGFHVHRTDGSKIDFSYIKAVRVASSM